MDHLGRAAFDPHYGLDSGIMPEDLGYLDSEVHDATPGLIEGRLKEVRARGLRGCAGKGGRTG